MRTNRSNDVDISSACHMIGNSKGELVFINYTAKKFGFSESKENVFFSDVTSVKFQKRVITDNSKRNALLAFLIFGFSFGIFSASNADPANVARDFFLSFVVSGLAWGGLVYAVSTFFKKEEFIFRIVATNLEFTIITDKSDRNRISNIFGNLNADKK
jgi:hypothetical protein